MRDTSFTIHRSPCRQRSERASSTLCFNRLFGADEAMEGSVSYMPKLRRCRTRCQSGIAHGQRPAITDGSMARLDLRERGESGDLRRALHDHTYTSALGV